MCPHPDGILFPRAPGKIDKRKRPLCAQETRAALARSAAGTSGWVAISVLWRGVLCVCVGASRVRLALTLAWQPVSSLSPLPLAVLSSLPPSPLFFCTNDLIVLIKKKKKALSVAFQGRTHSKRHT